MATSGLLLLSSVVLASTTGAELPNEIASMLQTHCFECHDANKQLAGLRLDVRTRTWRGGDSGEPAVVPGQPGSSELLRRVRSVDPDQRMPPEGEPLSDSQVALLEHWIKSGAAWPKQLAEEEEHVNHWAFQPPVRPQLPDVKLESWVRNQIDRFVLARLEADEMAPSPEADRVSLIRRLYLDLVGLPPSIEEVNAYLADRSPDAYNNVVESLLRSPHYGERWGRFWLDAARYADSDGYEKDKSRQVWFYRDWVVDALNRDLPYDQFIIQQLAGDLLPNATQDEIVATGFLRNSMINEEGGVDPEQFRMEAMFDRMDAIGKSILGLTIQCAQCHDHKYDPLSQNEYYQLFAYLNNDHEANVVVYTPEEQMQRARLFREMNQLEHDLRHAHPDWRADMRAWEEQVQRDQVEWTTIQPRVLEISTGGQRYLPQEDGSILALGYAPTKHTVELNMRVDGQDITAIQLELLTDPDLPLGGPGRSVKGTAALTEFELAVASLKEPHKKTKVKLKSATADFNPPEQPLESIYDDRSGKRRVTGPVEFAIDGNPETAWGTDAGPGRRNQPRKAVFVPESPIRCRDGANVTIYLSQQHGGWNSDDNQNHNLGKFRISITDADNAVADPLPVAVRKILAIEFDERTDEQVSAVFRFWRTTVPVWEDVNQRIVRLWEQHPEGSSQLVLQARPQDRMTHVLQRGDFLQPVKSVSADTPAFLHRPSKNPSETVSPGRLSFARWIVDRQSPTVARSIVNRVWQNYFGLGLVVTSEDLGTRCEPPSHPHLLDWLAVEFMDQEWSLKQLHRLIVNSATYRQTSRISPALYRQDPYNRLLARGPRFRVDAEVVRDIALAASGLLNPQIGGSSVYPPLPAFMLQPPVSYGPKVWAESTGPERFRRSLYTFRYRSVPYPALEVFDAPNGDFSCVRRSRSNTPLQALTTLNEPVFLECAQALALRSMKEGGDDDRARITYAFRRCLSRMPRAEETKELIALLNRQRSRLVAEEAEEFPMATSIPKALREDVPSAEASAWTAVTRVLLNLDETITKQ